MTKVCINCGKKWTRRRKPMGKFIDVEATADKIYKKYGTHPVYYEDDHTEEGKEARTNCIVLEMIYDESRMVYADVTKIIRCQNCVHWDKFPASTYTPEFHKCRFTERYSTADGFCDRAEEDKEIFSEAANSAGDNENTN